jgi:site-specific recombinase XerD
MGAHRAPEPKLVESQPGVVSTTLRPFPLFVSATGQRMTSRHDQYLVERLYVRASIRAQAPAGVLVHALHHTLATSALEGGASVLEVQQLLGHASLDTTRRYPRGHRQRAQGRDEGPSRAAGAQGLCDAQRGSRVHCHV